MLEFVKKSQKIWEIEHGDETIELNLTASSITNKFNIICDFIKRISKEEQNGEFDDWFFEFVSDAKNGVNNNLLDKVSVLKEYVDSYVDCKDIDFCTFVDRSKAKKGTILFEPDEIEKIMRASGYLKIYSIISGCQDIKIPHALHKEVYNSLVQDITDSEIVFKIFNIVKTKTFRYNLTDKYMWEYIKMIQCKTIDVHTVEIFNFIMNQIMVLCEEDKNPITYFVGVVEESVKWFLRSVYKKTIIYDDSISTEDIHGLNVDNLKTYSYNDTLGRLKGIAYEKIYHEIDKSTPMLIEQNSKSDKAVTEFQKRVLDVEFISPLADCLIFPIISKITNIPYSHFTTLSPEHSIVLSVYVQNLLTKVFKNEYNDLFSILHYFPTTQPTMATTYRIKNVNNSKGFLSIQNNIKNFFGFKTKILPYRIMSYFVGRTSRVNFCSIFDGKKLGGIPLSKIENDMVKFYTLFFAGRLDDKFEEMRLLLNKDF